MGSEKAGSKRTNDGFIQSLEKPALLWLCQRMPSWVSPDLLTAFGVLGGIVTALGYGLSYFGTGFLYLSFLGLVMNWLGDSLDGSLARFRNQSRERYGYFLDQSLDSLCHSLVVIGAGASPYARMDVSLFLLVAWLLVNICVFLWQNVSGVFVMSFAGMGLTEVRLLLILTTIVMIFCPPFHLTVLGADMTQYDLSFIAAAVVMLAIVFYTIATSAAQLREEDDLRSGR